jgi:hypothetical protein
MRGGAKNKRFFYGARNNDHSGRKKIWHQSSFWPIQSNAPKDIFQPECGSSGFAGSV